MQSNRWAVVVLFVLFSLSGFSGLIYESIWSHYLKLFLGHAAYAQALVLVIFMAGLALGAWSAGNLIHRLKNLLLAYAIVEGVIGAFGLVFHDIFVSVLAWAFDSVIPSLGSTTWILAFKWGVGGLLILPQAFLLGTTFPLMSNGLIRLFPGSPGANISMLYFTNSIGAAVGVLASSFFLIGSFGFPGTILAAGLVNLFLAVVVFGLSKKVVAESAGAHDVNRTISTRQLDFILVAALVTGIASFIYEIAWIRMLSMVFGSSTHSFELMLSAFIAGLALGGLWIRRRIDSLKNPIKYASWIQVSMGIAALATIPLYNFTFDLMAQLMEGTARTENGYFLFNVICGMIALMVMLPTTVLAGTTLPLFTKIMLDKGYGENSIGNVYASNTLGAILGITFAMLIGLPGLGLEMLIISGCVLDILLGMALFRHASAKWKTNKGLLALTASALLAIVFVSSLVEFNPHKMASGVYRSGQSELSEISVPVYLKDGRTASVAVFTNGRQMSLRTNGKPDASVSRIPATNLASDEPTQILAGALPIAIHPDARIAATIGMGSGTTSSLLLSSPLLKRVDTIEIERSIVEAARKFAPRSNPVFHDERSNIVVEDAKTYFSTKSELYDIVVSEPSNPWVSGVSSLFTLEFYSRVKQHLNENGVFIQWLQLYEINRELVFSVLKALSAEFPFYHIYATSNDLIIVAKADGEVPYPSDFVFSFPAAKKELGYLGASTSEHLKAFWVGDNYLLEGLLKLSKAKISSDYFPLLDMNAPKARFMDQRFSEISSFRDSYLPVLKFLRPELTTDLPKNNQIVSSNPYFLQVRKARQVLEDLETVALGTREYPVDTSVVTLLESYSKNCPDSFDSQLWIAHASQLSRITAAYLSPSASNRLWDHMRVECIHGVTDELNRWFSFYRALGARDVKEVEAASKSIMNAWQVLDRNQKQQVLGGLLLALIGDGRNQEALTYWKQFGISAFGGAGLSFTEQLVISQL